MSERTVATVAVWVVAGVLGAIALARLAGGGDDGGAAPVRIDGGGTAAGGPREAVLVHVAGAVRRPGLVRVARGERVARAVERAGGPTRRADLAGLNLAAQVADGQQVVVPRLGAAPVPGLAPGSAGAAKLGLGTATVEQLDEVDGIGPTLAERIVEHRAAHGGFGSLAELQEVEGIGEKRFQTLREALQP